MGRKGRNWGPVWMPLSSPPVLSGGLSWALVTPPHACADHAVLHTEEPLQLLGAVYLCGVLFPQAPRVCLGSFGHSALTPQLMASASCARVSSRWCGLGTFWAVRWVITGMEFLTLRDPCTLCLGHRVLKTVIRDIWSDLFPPTLSGGGIKVVPVTLSWPFKPPNDHTGKDYYHPLHKWENFYTAVLNNFPGLSTGQWQRLKWNPASGCTPHICSRSRGGGTASVFWGLRRSSIVCINPVPFSLVASFLNPCSWLLSCDCCCVHFWWFLSFQFCYPTTLLLGWWTEMNPRITSLRAAHYRALGAGSWQQQSGQPQRTHGMKSLIYLRSLV